MSPVGLRLLSVNLSEYLSQLKRVGLVGTKISQRLTKKGVFFTNSESTKFFLLFSFKTRQDKDSVEIKNGARLGYFQRKNQFAAPLKENETFFGKNNRGFVSPEFVKICLEQLAKSFPDSSQFCNWLVRHWFCDEISVLLWCGRHFLFFVLLFGKSSNFKLLPVVSENWNLKIRFYSAQGWFKSAFCENQFF